MALDGRAWENTIKRVSEGIVSLRVNYVRPFDGAGPNYSLATGFVVDAKRGVILTNRHVVTAGPVRGVATFLNKEEVPVFPLYRDPVHDFAFFRFDPRRVKFMRVIQIPLAPEEAKVGVEVRVVGNDAGEKLSILSGTLARLDREAPHYSSHGYNDFNTFYFSAASSTSGGSSGSPVLNIDGKAVALNAGGRVKEATSFYFPLDRVVRALRIILCPALSEDGAPTLTSFNTAKVFRGTIQTVFKHRPFDETRRLGLPDARESEVRSCFSDSTGMLVVEECVPSGPGDVAGLCPGDILISLNGVLCVGFVELEAQLDMAAEARMADGAGGSVEFVVWRSGSEHKVVVPVSDLHALVPSTILEVGASVLHTLSYHQAINYHVPCRGVFVAWAGYMLKRFGVTAHVLVDELDGVPTPDLDTFRRVFETFPNAQQVPLRYRMLSNHHVSHVSLVTVERTWFPMQSSTRDDSSGLWKSTSSPPPPDKQQVEVQSTTFMKPASGSEVAALVYTSLCTVSFDIPFLITGVAGTSFSGVGLVIDAARGLVVCDRNTVPITLGDCELCFAGSVLVKAKIKFLHPIHNFAVVQYDPKTLGDTPVRSAVFSPIEIAPGDENLTYVGLSRRHTVLSQSNVSCTRKEPFFVSCDMRPPRYAARNVELFHFDRVSAGLGGVFADEDGRVQAILASFSYASGSKNKDVFRGLPVSLLEWTVDSLRADVAPVVYTLEVSLGLISLAKARAGMGLSDSWVDRLSRKNELVRQVLKVTRVLTLSKSDGKLCVGDNLLAIDDSCLCTFRDVEKAVRGKETVTATVLRDGKCVTVEDLSVTQLGSDNTCRLVQWAGMLLQDTHRAVPLSTGFIPETVRGEKGVYCSRWCYGSPAHMYGLRAAAWITAVNGKKIANLDEFLGIVKQLEKKTERTRKEGVGEGEERKSDDGTSCVGGADDGSDDDEWEFVRLTTIDLSGKKKVCTLQPDPVYWPSMDLRRGEESDEWTLSSN